MFNQFFPAFYYQNIYEMNIGQLKKMGILGLILDIDNTLVPHDSQQIGEALKEWLLNRSKDGFKIILISNNNKGRVEEFALKLGLLFIHDANKPLKASFLEGAKRIGINPKYIAVVGDQIFTDVFGANRSGMVSVLLEPIEQRSAFFARIKYFLERPIRKKIREGKRYDSKVRGRGESAEFL